MADDDTIQILREIVELCRAKKIAAWQQLYYQHANPAFCKAAVAYLEPLGDQERAHGHWAEALALYTPAEFAGSRRGRLRAKREEVERKILEDRIAHPATDDATPDPLDWNNGPDRVETVVLAGRFADADALLERLESIRDDYGDRCIHWSGRFEWLGDQVERDHPEMARWFYDKAARWFRAWVASSSSGGEGLARSEEKDTATPKLARVSARLGLPHDILLS